MDASELLGAVELLPVVTLRDADHAVPLAEALLQAGVGAIEITLRSDAALEGIAQVAQHVPEMIVGAGSVRRAEQFAQIQAAGAQFAVSPGATEKLLAAANMPYVAGIATASEAMSLFDAGYKLQKFFPAEINGGVAALKAIGAPLPEVRFCPTGGVNDELAPRYLALSNVACVGGSWFIDDQALIAGDYAQVAETARAAVAALA